MHGEAHDWIEANRPVPSAAAVLEIGSYNVNGSVRDLFTEVRLYLGIDLRPGLGVDQVVGASDFDGLGRYDIVVCTSVMEHVLNPADVTECAWRALRSAGLLLLTTVTPQYQPHGNNGGPVGTEHYAGIEPSALEVMLRDWEDVLIDYHPGRAEVYARAVKP